MYPTDPSSISGIPSQNRAVTLGSILGLSTVILGTTLLKVSPLSRPVHLALGGVLGAAGGFLLHFGAVSMQNRVLLAHDYIERVRQSELNKN